MKKRRRKKKVAGAGMPKCIATAGVGQKCGGQRYKTAGRDAAGNSAHVACRKCGKVYPAGIAAAYGN